MHRTRGIDHFLWYSNRCQYRPEFKGRILSNVVVARRVFEVRLFTPHNSIIFILQHLNAILLLSTD